MRGRDLKSILDTMDRKGEYKRRSSTITKEGTLIRIGSRDGRQELAMVLKFVKGSQVGNPHEDYIVIGTYKYSDIDAAILSGSDQRPPLQLVVARVTGKNSYRILDANRIDLMNRIREVAGRDQSVRDRCGDLYNFELIQCMSDKMALAYLEGASDDSESPVDSPHYETPDNLAAIDVDLSGPSHIEANTIAIVEDQEDYDAVLAPTHSEGMPTITIEHPESDGDVGTTVPTGSAEGAE